MKIVEPSFEIVSPEQFDREAGVRILKLIERIGRVCYKSEGKITEESCFAFVRMLLARGHLSVLEHASVTVKITANRGFTHELVRHRLASYSQESTRFCNYAKDGFGSELTFVPDTDQNSPRDLELWAHSMSAIEQTYMVLIASGEKTETARDILPNSLKADIVITANLREWMHIFALRTSPKAHPLMRRIMTDIKYRFNLALPEIF